MVTSCDLNNNFLKFSHSLASIIDVDEDDNSGEDDFASLAVIPVHTQLELGLKRGKW